MANHSGVVFDSYSKCVMAIYFQVLFHNTADLQYQAPSCLDKHDNHIQQLTSEREKCHTSLKVRVSNVAWSAIMQATSACSNNIIYARLTGREICQNFPCQITD